MGSGGEPVTGLARTTEGRVSSAPSPLAREAPQAAVCSQLSRLLAFTGAVGLLLPGGTRDSSRQLPAAPPRGWGVLSSGRGGQWGWGRQPRGKGCVGGAGVLKPGDDQGAWGLGVGGGGSSFVPPQAAPGAWLHPVVSIPSSVGLPGMPGLGRPYPSVGAQVRGRMGLPEGDLHS